MQMATNESSLPMAAAPQVHASVGWVLCTSSSTGPSRLTEAFDLAPSQVSGDGSAADAGSGSADESASGSGSPSTQSAASPVEVRDPLRDPLGVLSLLIGC